MKKKTNTAKGGKVDAKIDKKTMTPPKNEKALAGKKKNDKHKV